MNLINIIDNHGRTTGDKVAYIYRESVLTYEELEKKSNLLANYLLGNFSNNKGPVVVYGHKQKEMLISFLACVKSGHPYVPVDISLPAGRIEYILENTGAELILNVDDFNEQSVTCNTTSMSRKEILDIIEDKKYTDLVAPGLMGQGDPFYIIYTSGSTGIPKGSKIPLSSLESFVRWGHKLCGNFQDSKIFLNQAPYSFDLSVMELYVALYTGSTIFSLDRRAQTNFPELLDTLGKSNVNIWVSTPSFAEMCLKSKKMSEELLPNLTEFVFCGEILTNNCAHDLLERFPKGKIINCYGPSECTFAVTAIEITKEICDTVNPLPVGYVKEDCEIVISKDGENVKTEGEEGEIIIAGESVGLGYHNNDEMTKDRFSEVVIDNKLMRSYRTGDKGYLLKDILYYCGRLDNQIKLNGYRIELEDIEANIRKIPGIENCIVIPTEKNGRVRFLTGLVTLKKVELYKESMEQFIREQLGPLIPDYMIPSRIIIKEQLPMTSNGKIDRNALFREINKEA